MQLRPSYALLALAVAVALPSVAQAQGRDVYLLPVPAAMDMSQITGRAAPGIAASSPVGFGPMQGDVFAGIGYQAKSSAGSQDGAITGGMGFLDPNKTVGLEVVLTSLSTVRSGFGSRMVAGLKAHKVLPNQIGVGVGIEGVKLIGDEFDIDPSFYVAATKIMPLAGRETFNQISFNLGLGNGRFQSAADYAAGESGIGVFAGASVKMTWWSSAILDYTGAQANLAFSFTPSKSLPLVITPAINDLGGDAGPAGRFAVGIGYSWTY